VPEQQAVNDGNILPIRARERAAIQHMTAKPTVPFSPSTVFSSSAIFLFFRPSFQAAMLKIGGRFLGETPRSTAGRNEVLSTRSQ